MKSPVARTPSPIAVLAVIVTAALAAPAFLSDGPWPRSARDYLETRAEAESGAKNIVSAIYLGYRAFDTLGETVVLTLAVVGTMSAMGKRDRGAREAGDRPRRADRTELIDVVTGKIAPIVMMFGVYVMMYGHLSPGGGFQGGVVVASGIVFLALGSRASDRVALTSTKRLARLEALVFSLLMMACAVGIAAGTGFLANPFPEESPVGHIILMNALIGLKVGVGLALVCVTMLSEAEP